MGLVGELENKFRRAVDAFHANDLVKAERILQQIAKSSRNIFDVEHLLGVVRRCRSGLISRRRGPVEAMFSPTSSTMTRHFPHTTTRWRSIPI